MKIALLRALAAGTILVGSFWIAQGSALAQSAQVVQEPTPDDVRSAAAGRWLTSLPKAQALAQKDQRLILLDFTGSDWCPWCMKLEAEVFSRPEFLKYARKSLVLVRVDFPKEYPQPPKVR